MSVFSKDKKDKQFGYDRRAGDSKPTSAVRIGANWGSLAFRNCSGHLMDENPGARTR